MATQDLLVKLDRLVSLEEPDSLVQKEAKEDWVTRDPLEVLASRVNRVLVVIQDLEDH